MRASQRFFQIVLRAAANNVLLVLQIIVKDLLQVKNLRLSVHQRKHNGAESLLQLRMLIQIVEHHHRINILLQLQYHTHTVFIRLIAQRAQAFKTFFFIKLRNFFHQAGFIDLIRDLGNYNSCPISSDLLDLMLGAHHNAPLTGQVSIANAAEPHDRCAGREVRPFNMLHQLFDRDIRVIDQGNQRADGLSHIMRRNVCRHTYGNAVRSVNQQVRKAGRQHARLKLCFIKVRVKIHRLFINIGQHLSCDLGKLRLRITRGSGRIAVYRAEISLPKGKRVTKRERLRQAHQRIIDRRISVRVIFTHNITDNTSAFTRRLIGRIAGFMHRIKNAAMDRL